MGNRLGDAASPYLLQHKDNPVDWWPWGPEALAEAKTSGRPILLSIGYAACHWCHVMAHESFEDPETAALMNRLFVNVKVDREERPDIDQIYMSALHAMGEQGGWPLTMFLTPDGEPVWGGTYFPKQARWGKPSFKAVLEEVARIFREESTVVDGNRQALVAHLTARARGRADLSAGLAVEAANRIARIFDPVFGGPRGAPKFPQAPVLELLWRAHLLSGQAGMPQSVKVTLKQMALGGIHDHVGGGFARYSVDAEWLVPHFEKMLYDNAQLLDLYSRACVTEPDEIFADAVNGICEWLFREMRTAGGAFASSLDADSEGEEGKFYVWTYEELEHLAGAGFDLLKAAFDIAPEGNWEGRIVLRRRAGFAPSPADRDRLRAALDRLFNAREKRLRPGLDDKVLADWNGLAIAALARAGLRLGRTDLPARAEDAYKFVSTTMTRNGRLGHAWREGRLVFPGLSTDYAAMIKAALALFSATGAATFRDDALRWTDLLERHHADPEGGYFLTADDAEALIVRPRGFLDEATPNANGTMVQNLVQLWLITGEAKFRDRADAILEAASGAIVQNVFGMASLLTGLGARLDPVQTILVVPEGLDAGEMARAAARLPQADAAILRVADGAELPLLHPAAGKRAVDGRVTAYLCRGETCSLPVADPNLLTFDPGDK